MLELISTGLFRRGGVEKFGRHVMIHAEGNCEFGGTIHYTTAQALELLAPADATLPPFVHYFY
jgi:hypothetical protein